MRFAFCDPSLGSHLLIVSGLTATLLTLANLVGVGVRSLAGIVMAGVSLPAVQLCGYVIERLKNKMKAEDALVWVVFGIGFLVQSGAFAAVAIGVSTQSNTVETAGGSESYDGFLIQSGFYFAFFFSFALIMVLWVKNVLKEFWEAEVCYLIASLCCKSGLFWLIVSTTRGFLSQFDAVEHNNENWELGLWLSAGIPTLLVFSAAVIVRSLRPSKEKTDTATPQNKPSAMSRLLWFPTTRAELRLRF